MDVLGGADRGGVPALRLARCVNQPDNAAMPTDEERRRLSGAVFRGDGAEIVEILARRPWPADRLQLIGDGLLIALGAGVEGAPPLVAECVTALRARGWTGDPELADGLESLAKKGSPPLPPLPVDLAELAESLEGDPVYGGGRIDLRTGEVWPQAAIDYGVEEGELDEDDEDPDRWLRIDCVGSRDGYRDMQWFVDDLDDPEIADRLSIALQGRGAFRRFRDVLSRWDELVGRWHSFSDDRKRGRARSWLADQGYAAMPRILPD